MQKYLFFITLLLFALAGCKEFHDDTVVNGRIVDIITGEPVPNETVLFAEVKGSLTPDAITTDYFAEVVSDQNGEFTFTFEAKPWDRFTYYGMMTSYTDSDIYLTDVKGLKYTTGDLTKYQSNTVELKVAKKAYIWVKFNNDTTPSGGDLLMYRYYNDILGSDEERAFKTKAGLTTPVDPTAPIQYQTQAMGPYIIEWEVTKANGKHYTRRDSLWLNAGEKRMVNISY